MNHYLAQFITVAGLHLLAVISPGPDFIMVTQNSINYSRKIGILSAIGLGLGILVHVSYSLIGLAYVISQSIVLFSIIKVLGGLYLVYIGVKSLLSKTPSENQVIETPEQSLSPLGAVWMGFLTNVLNPKATLFFLSIFTLVINQNTPLPWKVAYGLEMSLVTFAWFTVVAFIFSHHQLRTRINSAQKYIQRGLGTLLIALGLKVVLSK